MEVPKERRPGVLGGLAGVTAVRTLSVGLLAGADEIHDFLIVEHPSGSYTSRQGGSYSARRGPFSLVRCSRARGRLRECASC